jgi:hypothetical protein
MARTTRAAARYLTLVLIALSLVGEHAHLLDEEQFEGRAPTAEELTPSVEAAFARESYAPGTTATLKLFNAARRVSVQVFRSGPEHAPTVGNDELVGMPMGEAIPVGHAHLGGAVTIHIGSWPSGLYYARLRSSDGRTGFAPFVVHPRRLGAAEVAVVMPTLTWQAYNLRDDDGDGQGDSWYARWSHLTVRLDRPFLNRGVPFNFRRYDLPFLHWLAWNGHAVDLLADSDLERTSGAALARAYRLVIFPGHHEYVTTREYDNVERYRDLGGHLMFLSANDFFWRVLKHGDVIEKTQQWRDLGRPEAALIGVEYRGNDRGTHRAPWTVRDVEAAPWLFDGTGLSDGMPIGSAGIEIDKTCSASPKNVRVLADVRNLFGPGFTAQMTYYETPRGAEVFAAGAFTLAGSALQPVVSRLLENLWDRLAGAPAH